MPSIKNLLVMPKRLSLAALLGALFIASHLQAATDLSTLTTDQQNTIDRLCSPVQFREGASAYRDCVQTEIVNMQLAANSALSNLSVDDMYAVNQFCEGTGTNVSTCMSKQAAAARNFPAPAMTNINEDEQFAIQQSCFNAQTTQGLLAYRQCLVNEVASLTLLPQPDLSKLSIFDRNELQLQCSANNRSAADYRRCLNEVAQPLNTKAVNEVPSTKEPVETPATKQPEPTKAETPAPQPEATETIAEEPAAAPINNIAPDTPDAIDSNVKLDNQTQNTTDEAVFDTPSEPVDSPAEKLFALLGTTANAIQTKFNALTDLGKLVVGTVLLTPFAMFFIGGALEKARVRRRKQMSVEYQIAHAFDEQDDGPSTDLLKARWDDDQLDLDATIPVQRDTTTDSDETRIVDHTAAAKPQWLSGFGKWLETTPKQQQQQYSTEFLIYWMAYADERYDKELKTRIFTEQNPTDQELIKRWVLKQDVYAFADTIHWFKTNTDSSHQAQLIDLLLALLVNEKAISPTQNIILRMLADTFGIGTSALEERFITAFGEALPSFPNTDQQAWWQEQSAETVLLWDARRVANLPVADQMRSRLGLDVDYSESDLVSAFRRAAKRCHPDRFELLGSWEKTLVQRHFKKFEEARDLLQGVSV